MRRDLTSLSGKTVEKLAKKLTIQEIENEIKKALNGALHALYPHASGSKALIALERPRNEKFGDLSANIALRLSKEAGKSPRKVAEDLVRHMKEKVNANAFKAVVSQIQIDGPGFINFELSSHALGSVLSEIANLGENFGSSMLGSSKKVLLEFVSANPTGPLTVAHGRQAAIGDSLARILKFVGYKVHAEYYNNDEGFQIETLGQSVYARLREERGEKDIFPENGYRGDYIRDLAKDYLREKGDKHVSAKSCGDYAMEKILATIQKDLKDFEVAFDSFYSQMELGRSGKVEETLGKLKDAGKIYDKEGATWFRSTDYKDDKDRVLIKSDKSYTYLTPDIAYHRDKFSRGFDRLINIWGPDHHGYISRLLASQEALGFDSGSVRVLIAQLVTLYQGKKKFRMSTRAGEFITLRQILDAVGRDAARFFFVMRKCDSHLDFDLELAKSQSQENPVYYVQYAHARISSIQKLQEEREIKLTGVADPGSLSEAEAKRVLRALRQFPQALTAAADALEPSYVVEYLKNLSSLFHQFYNRCRIVTDDVPVTQARLALAFAVRTVLATGLRLLGVSAPKKM